MKTVYLFSNFDNNTGFPKEIGDCIKKDLLVYESLVFISSSPLGYDASDFYSNVNKNWFSTIGINFRKCYLLDNRIERNRSIDLLKNASCIFLMGGRTREQIKYVNENNFMKPLQNYNGVIMGISAGAINLSINSLSFGRSENEETTIMYNGIGITEKIIFPHFDINGEENNEIKEYSKDHCIYGLCDYSAIIEKGNDTKLIGEIYKIHNRKIDKISG